MGLFQEQVFQLVIQLFFQPERMPRIVVGLEADQPGRERIAFGLVGRCPELETDQIGFENVFRGWQDIGNQVLALHDALIQRAVDLEIV